MIERSTRNVTAKRIVIRFSVATRIAFDHSRLELGQVSRGPPCLRLDHVKKERPFVVRRFEIKDRVGDIPRQFLRGSHLQYIFKARVRGGLAREEKDPETVSIDGVPDRLEGDLRKRRRGDYDSTDLSGRGKYDVTLWLFYTLLEK